MTRWGTTKVREIQLAMLLEENKTRPATLLSRALYYTGLCGLTFAWSAIPGMEYSLLSKGKVNAGGKSDDDESKDESGVDTNEDEQEGQQQPTDTLISSLYQYGWDCVKSYWQGKGTVTYNKDLIEGV